MWFSPGCGPDHISDALYTPRVTLVGLTLFMNLSPEGSWLGTEWRPTRP